MPLLCLGAIETQRVSVFSTPGHIVRAILASSLQQAAQDVPAPSEWSAVRAVPPGAELVTKLKNGQTVKGRLKVISDIHLTLARGRRSFDLDRQNVWQIHRVVPKSAAGFEASLKSSLRFFSENAFSSSNTWTYRYPHQD